MATVWLFSISLYLFGLLLLDFFLLLVVSALRLLLDGLLLAPALCGRPVLCLLCRARVAVLCALALARASLDAVVQERVQLLVLVLQARLGRLLGKAPGTSERTRIKGNYYPGNAGMKMGKNKIVN